MNDKAGKRNPLNAEYRLLQASVLLLLFSICVANLVSTFRSQESVEDLASAQDDVWREIFPDSRLPRGVLPRLQSELNKLVGVRAGAADNVANESVLPLVCQSLQALPPQMRFRLIDLKIDGKNLDLSGEVRDFADADRIASAIQSAGFQVKSPTTRRLPEQGVGLRLQAAHAPPTSVK